MLDALPIAAPALPLDEAGKYVAAAYIVFVVLILVYVAIMAAKLQRIERELRELAGFAEQRRGAPFGQRQALAQRQRCGLVRRADHEQLVHASRSSTMSASSFTSRSTRAKRAPMIAM